MPYFAASIPSKAVPAFSLTELVDVCHGAENVFDILRNGKRTVTAELMDVILQALDAINDVCPGAESRTAKPGFR